MAKTRTDIAKVTPTGGALVAPKPEYLSQEPVEGMELAREYVLVPRLKTVQKSAGERIFSAGFGVGDLILVPTMDPLMRIGRNPANGAPEEEGPPLLITPLYFFPEWVTWNPYGLANEPAIVYRTRDPKDPIVEKSRKRQLRLEPMKNGDGSPRLDGNNRPMAQRHVEHLNWVVVLHNHETIREPFVISFARGEHFTGLKFASLVRKRDASPFYCQFEMRAKYRPPRSGTNDWYGVEPENPRDQSVGPWVSESDAKLFKSMYEELREADKERTYRPNLEEADDLVGGDDDPATGAGVADGQRSM